MKYRLHILLILFSLCSIFVLAEDKGWSATSLRVMTYNLRFGELADFDSLAKQINDLNPDFVALQEIDVFTKRKAAPEMNGKNMVNELASKTGMFGIYARTINFAGGYYGIAILSKYPCIKSERFMLPNPRNTEQRCLLKGVFELNDSQNIIFACTHLDVKSAETRKLQADFILQNIQQDSIPVILGGDFNATPNENSIDEIMLKMDNISGEGFTFPASVPDRKIDYIFSAPKGKCKVKHTEVINTTQSDHRAVFSVIEF